jgi:anti-sigma regulatory factor (Ser/Thr protein kinase)
MPGRFEGDDLAGGPVLLALAFDLGTLDVTRRAVRGSLSVDQLGAERAHGFLAAINEGLINAIEHGGGRGRVVLVRVGRRLVAVVEDVRPAGQLVFPQAAPPPEAERGRGLWIIAQSCDAVRVESGRIGLRLVMELAIGAQ